MRYLGAFILCVATLAVVSAQSDVVVFRRTIADSKRECRKRNIKNTVDATCKGTRTLADIVSEIPGGRTTVRPYAGADLMKTFDLCLTREDGSSTDWKNLVSGKTRIETGATARDDVLKECRAQIVKEKKDCANMKEMLCAFSQGLDFSCMSDNQKRRTANTINQDECFQLAAVADNRPNSLKEFNAKLRETRSNCRKEQDEVTNRCRAERSMEAIMRQVPRGVNVLAKAGSARSDLRQTIELCLAREDYGFPEFRRQAITTYRGKTLSQRRPCLDQLKKEEDDCADAKKIVCAFTYGVDFSCAPASQKASSAGTDACFAVEQKIKTDSIRR